MKHQSGVNYKFGRKNNWRARQWNEIERRVENRKSKTVLYLAALGDLDRREALRRGFSNQNIFAVDRDYQVVEELRKQKKPAIHGNLTDVLLSFGGADVVVADFCSGYTAENIECFLAAMFTGVNKGGVVLVNMLRGRERGLSSELRGHFSSLIISGIETGRLPSDADPLHRGLLLLYGYLDYLTHQLSSAGYSKSEIETTFYRVQKRINAIPDGYRCESGPGYMNSLLLSQLVYEPCDTSRVRNSKLMRQIAAQKAWATIRKGGRHVASAKT